MRLVLGLYQQQEKAIAALQDLSSRKFYRSAIIHRTNTGNIVVHQNKISAVRQLFILISVATLALLAGTYTNLPIALVVLVGFLSSLLCWLTMRDTISSIDRNLLNKYSRWLFEGETLIVIETSEEKLSYAFSLLRGAEGNRPSIFFIRSSKEFGPELLSEPQRKELLTEQQLKDYAVRLAAGHRVAAPILKPQALSKKLNDYERVIVRVRKNLTESIRLEQGTTSAAEWLLDNFYSIRGHIADFRRNLPKQYYKILPILIGPHGISLRVYNLALELAQQTDFKLNSQNISDFLNAYQTVCPLTIGELWVFPLMLRFALIEELQHRAIQVDRYQSERERAGFWANRLLNAARRHPDQLSSLLSDLGREQPKIQSHFAIRLIGYLYDEETALSPVQNWLETKLDLPLQDVIRQEQARLAANQLAVANAVGSLRQLSQMDWREIFEYVSHVEKILCADPAGIYINTDFSTRDRCRRAVEEIARHARVSELDVARQAIQLAKNNSADNTNHHIGYYLIDEGRLILENLFNFIAPIKLRGLRFIKNHSHFIYFGGIGFLTFLTLFLFVVAASSYSMQNIAAIVILGFFAIFPASELSIQIVNYLINLKIPPHVLPKMHFRNGIPEQHRTLVAVPMMLLTKDAVLGEIEKLEVRYLANPDANLCFSLLSDFTDAPNPQMPEDENLLLVAADGIKNLNLRYGERFFLFHRPRVWGETEQKWMGWERKRGKIEELNYYLYLNISSGAAVECKTPLRNYLDKFLCVGNKSALGKISFVITLDADTQLPHESARRLIETLAHPLNRPEINEKGIVTKGYGIIQPRVSSSLPSATTNTFTRLFTDPNGTDPYTQAVSDVHQDLFGEAIYHGKAIYDVAAFHQTLSNRFPQETILSHDLLEGTYLRVGYASDIELFEQFPSSYQSYSKRQHRWIRGDWQIIGWLAKNVPTSGGNERNPLTAINRWKIFDNLRRSVVPIAALALLLVSWLFSITPVVWSALVGLVLIMHAILPLPVRCIQYFRGNKWVWRDEARDLGRTVVLTALLPQQAWVTLDAVTRVWYRSLISRRHLLEWETAQVADWQAKHHINIVIKQVLFIALAACLTIFALISQKFLWWDAALPFLCLWISSPLLLWWLNKYQPRKKIKALNAEDKLFLRQLACHTWRYFDDLVTQKNNWLPPDNSQEALRIEVAPRTSPTNIGLWLCSLSSTRDFGYLTPLQIIERASKTFSTLAQLERYEGHLLNWYNIETLEPLHPRYVSTVDSGNLIASLWVFIENCKQLIQDPIIDLKILNGLADIVAILKKLSKDNSQAVYAAITDLTTIFEESNDAIDEIVKHLNLAVHPTKQLIEALQVEDPINPERLYWAEKLQTQLNSWISFVNTYLPWIETLNSLDKSAGFFQTSESRQHMLKGDVSLKTLASGDPSRFFEMEKAKTPNPKQIQQIINQFQEASLAAQKIIKQINLLIAESKKIEKAINMGFLYNQKRRLFTIGYNVSQGYSDTSYYDLLASEARLASLVAIARTEVPIEHWLALGRPFGSVEGKRVLLSWSGSMFEYLMPLLFNKNFENSLLEHACHEAVSRQIEYANKKNIPWGISESAYSALDANQTYQYRGFGIPGLGLKRDLDQDVVVAPYATVLALAVNPSSAVENLKKLSKLGLYGNKGFYEAIDYTRDRNPEGQRGVIVYAYMAHHQGMSFLAINNALNKNVLQKRFHKNLRIRTIESLFFERIPSTAPLFLNTAEDRNPQRLNVTIPAHGGLRINTQNTLSPKTQLLCNGNYTLMITNSGGGYSRWRNFEINRWRADTTRDTYGSFCYIRDIKNNEIWSPTFHPIDKPERRYSATFAADRVEFRRRDTEIETFMEVIISPDDDAEIRRLSLINHSSRTRYVELTTYIELALAPHNADRTHPAFNKLFIQTEALPESSALLAWRRMRTPEEATIWTGHLITPEGANDSPFQYDTDRASFLGRSHNLKNPVSIETELANHAGFVLDPIFSLRRRVIVEPGQRVRLALVTVAAETREQVLNLVKKYRDFQMINRTFDLAWTYAQIELRFLGIQAEEAQRFQELASYLIYPSKQLRSPPERLRRNILRQADLWGYSISGDLPILVVTVNDNLDLDLVREALMAHSYWRARGLKVDLIILNKEASGYDQSLQTQLRRLVQIHSLQTGTEKPGGVFLRVIDQIPENGLTLLLASAWATLVAARGPLAQQLSRSTESLKLPRPHEFEKIPENIISPPLPYMELPYFNGTGGFTTAGDEYVIYLGPGKQTPAPWINVISNPDFGTLVSEAGSGCTWYGNSQMNRLTPWSNDAVSNPVADMIYLRDEETGVYWTPTPLPAPAPQEAYRIRHGQGYSICENNNQGIEQELLTFVPVNNEGGAPIRIQRLRLKNSSGRNRRLSITAYLEWVLGNDREETQLHVTTMWDENSQSLLARNVYHPHFNNQISFITITPAANSFTSDRAEFLGRNGSMDRPQAMQAASLSNQVGIGLDPCGALQTLITLSENEEKNIYLLVGQGNSIEHVHKLIAYYTESADQSFDETRNWWNNLLGTIQVKTPELSVDLMLNRWLLYQTLGCRIWARNAFYQSGGAFGFRDQLQDVLALVYTEPALVRNHILLAAAHQFKEGDVQHWWHPPFGSGVRSRCSDDLLWLPYVTSRYVRLTGDVNILDEIIPFLEGRELEEHEAEIYFTPEISNESASLFEHCQRAIERGSRLGPHGLVLIGSGDWNDGMNHVGIKGQGESVWLTWFMIDVLKKFSELCERRNNFSLVEQYQLLSKNLKKAIEQHAWDGEWYKRAYFDDGTPLGSKENMEAQIDSLSQSWAVISGAADSKRADQALQSAEKYLVRESEKLILLFTPPFEHLSHHPGYIKGYPPGVRENGGQYTHAALWLAQAFAYQGNGTRAAELLRMMNPIERTRTPEDTERYKGEPYYVAADIYGLEGQVGRSGWTGYTGSSGLMYRIWIEDILGFKRAGEELTIAPAIPNVWEQYQINYDYYGSHYEITIENPTHTSQGVLSVKLNGKSLSGNKIKLTKNLGKQEIRVIMGAKNKNEATEELTRYELG